MIIVSAVNWVAALVMRNSHVRDVIAGMMKEVCHDVQVEPHLIPVESKDLTQPKANKEANAKLEIYGKGIWAPFHKTVLNTVKPQLSNASVLDQIGFRTKNSRFLHLDFEHKFRSRPHRANANRLIVYSYRFNTR